MKKEKRHCHLKPSNLNEYHRLIEAFEKQGIHTLDVRAFKTLSDSLRAQICLELGLTIPDHLNCDLSIMHSVLSAAAQNDIKIVASHSCVDSTLTFVYVQSKQNKIWTVIFKDSQWSILFV